MSTRHSPRRQVMLAIALASALSMAPVFAVNIAAEGRPKDGRPIASTALSRPQLAAIFREIAALGPRRIAFFERRVSSLLSDPLESRGELRYVPPDRFEKEVREPANELLSIVGDAVSVQSPDGGIRRLRIDAHPALQGLAATLRGTLGGDLAGLERVFELNAAGDPARWRIELTPRADTLRAAVRTIVIEGAGATLRSVELNETSGDRVETWMLGTPPTRVRERP